MTIRDDARQEAERRWPALSPDAEELTYPRSAIRRMARGAFEAGAVWASERADREAETVRDEVTAALRRLADVIEYAEQVGIVRRATVLDLARGETNEEVRRG